MGYYKVHKHHLFIWKRHCPATFIGEGTPLHLGDVATFVSDISVQFAAQKGMFGKDNDSLVVGAKTDMPAFFA